MVHGGANKAGGFLEVSIYVEGGRKGVLWLPEGHFRQGWRCLAGELRLMLLPLEGENGPEESKTRSLLRMQSKQPKAAWFNDAAGVSKDRSFAEVLQLKSRSDSKGRSSLCMDLCQMSSCSEVENGGVDQRSAVNCFELENSLLGAGSSKKMRGISVKRRVKQLLRFFHLEMGWVIAGLFVGLLAVFEGIPIRKRVRAILNILDGFKGFRLGPTLMPNSVGRFKGSRKALTGIKGFGLGSPLKPKRSVRLKSADEPVQDAIVLLGSSLEAALESSPHVAGTKSSSSPMSEIHLDALVISNDEPLESVCILGEDIGTAVDGSSWRLFCCQNLRQSVILFLRPPLFLVRWIFR
jgi:hypothetical protein